MPPVEGAAARLANWLDGPHFETVRRAIAKRVLKELTGPRRLRPKDAAAEIDLLRALAMALTAASGRLMALEDVQNAFVERSRMLVREDFVEAYLGVERTPLAEVEALIWLAENVTGAANKRQASRWIGGKIGALRVETDQRQSSESVAGKLATLARLQRVIARAGFAPEDAAPLAKRIGEIGGLVEAENQLTAALARASAPAAHRLTLLLGLAIGESAPLGPAADRAKAEVIRLMRAPETRAELARAPESVDRVRSLLKSAGLAALFGAVPHRRRIDRNPRPRRTYVRRPAGSRRGGCAGWWSCRVAPARPPADRAGESGSGIFEQDRRAGNAQWPARCRRKPDSRR